MGLVFRAGSLDSSQGFLTSPEFAALSDVWFTLRVAVDATALTYFTDVANPNYLQLVRPFGAGTAGTLSLQSDPLTWWGPTDSAIEVTPNEWHLIEYHRVTSSLRNLYVDGVLIAGSSPGSTTVGSFNLGITALASHDPDAVIYIDDLMVGTAQGIGDIFSEDFEDGTFDAWDTTSGDVSIVDDPFPSMEGIVWSPTGAALDVSPAWVRMDDPTGYRLVTGFSIVRGRQSETDRTATGTATIAFTDSEGILDPTNPSSPFAGNLDPMKQAAIVIKNPVTEEWQTLFRGFVAGPDHQLDMFTSERGIDTVSWQLVDAFDLFANVILTHGVHGDDPGLADFPNIYYPGTPSNLETVADDFVHVDQRIIRLLDDAGWPGTGNAFDDLRNIFSGNVSVQGVVYSRKDSLLSALFDAADAEFPGIANIYISKNGVVTFHGRFARFFPDNPGYGINHWYVGSEADAELDPDVVPLSGPIRFYRSKDDIINACVAMAQGTDETDPAVDPASDPASQLTFGYRSENFEGLLTSAGHNDDFTPTTMEEECNKFAAYYVGNYSDPQTRVGTLRFQSRGEGAIGRAALWRLLTEVEIGDVITLTTAHAGGGGFGSDFFVEQIRYQADYLSDELQILSLELEVSPATFFAYNPFGDNDNEFS